jgi:hypothetical protein
LRLLDHTPHPVGTFRTGGLLVAEAATYTTKNTHKRRTTPLSGEFEAATPATEKLQADALDGAATGIGL